MSHRDKNRVGGFYRLPEEVIEDVSFFRLELGRFLKGEVSPDRFKPFRVARGIYAQRGQSTFMVRIKVPAGGLVPLQMERIAELSEIYGNGIPHITTRQDVQIHWVKIEDTIKVIEGLADVGLTPKGGGGNTVRNITACSDSGVCDREVFDVAPYAISLTEYFLKRPKAFNLPRKFKIAFSGCSDDCALATINDVGFIAKKKMINGEEKNGFSVYVAGGMGAYSRVASRLEDFILEGECVYVAEAVMNLFYKYGNRRNKHKARLRFVIDRFGYDKFKSLYREELQKLKEEGISRPELRDTPVLREIKPGRGSAAFEEVDIPGFKAWLNSNVRPQRQEGYFYAKIRLPIGDITAEDLKRLARIVRGVGEGCIRSTHDQNIIIRWLGAEELPTLFKSLREIGLDEAGAGGVDDVICCPGAATCNLGICLSKNMAKALSDDLKKSSLPLKSLHGIDIKISGCPNSCGQHPIGAIGLHGAARRGNGRMAPHYELLLGGMVEEGKTRLGEAYGFVPAKNIPILIKKILEHYSDRKIEGERFHAFLERSSKEDIKNIIKKYSYLPPYEEQRDYYIDWGEKAEFSIAGLGPGECGAGIFDMIESDMENAVKHLNRVKELFERGTPSPEDLYKSLLFASKALLITRGIEPVDDLQAFKSFEEHFVNKGLLPERFEGLQRKGAQILSGPIEKAALIENIKLAEELITRIKDLYDSMDDSLRFRLEGVKTKESKVEQVSEKGSADVIMDLRGVKCPINYVKAKIKLEEMVVGQTLLLYLDEGEPIRNVPSSLKNDGQDIVKMEKTDEYYTLLVKKKI